MLLFLLVICVCLGSAFSYTIDALHDIITELPGQDSASKSTQFSGYLPISNTRFIHYYYIESEGSPENDPLVFWTNGGPGCSGLLGLFTEFGPWRPTSNASVERNPFTWSRLANIVFLEQPVGVGFSYTLEANLTNNFNDYLAAVDNLLIVKKFFERFPERANKDFYLASESYGGHYIPHWTLQILDDPSNLKQFFRGYLLGNPYTSYASGSIAGINVMWGLQLLPLPAWEEAQKATCEDISHNPYYMVQNIPQCFDYIDEFFNFTQTLNPYALDFPTCSFNVPYSRHSQKLRRLFSGSAQAKMQMQNYQRVNTLLSPLPSARPTKHFRQKLHHERNAMSVSMDGSVAAGSVMRAAEKRERIEGSDNIEYNPCTQAYTIAYMNNPEVQKALHVDTRPVQLEWNFCNDNINGNWSFSDFLANTTHHYSTIYNHPNRRKDFKMLVFSGDSDGVCATVGTQHWIYNVQNANILSLFKPWAYEDTVFGLQQGGFLTQFSGYLSFATVHYAGHEVPAYQPQRALSLFAHYLNGSLFSNYNEDASMAGTGESSSNSNASVLIIVLVTLLVVMTVMGASYIMSPKVKEMMRSSRSNSIGTPDMANSPATRNPLLQ